MSIDRAKVAKQAETYLASGRPGKAIEEFYKLLEDNPSDLNLANRLGDILVQEKRDKEAMEMFRLCAQGFEADGFTNKAVAIYRKAFRYCPHDRELASRLLVLYERLHMNRDAMQVRVKLVDALAAADRIAEALEECRRLVDHDPRNVKTRVMLADLCQREGKAGEAAEHFIRAAEILASEKKQGDADDLLERAKELDSTPKVFLGASRVCALQDDFLGAKRHLEHGLEANPKETDLLEAKAEMELRLNQPMAALESLVAGPKLTGRALPIIERALKVCLVVGTAAHGVETIEKKIKEFARRGFAEEAKATVVAALGDHPVPEYWLLLADLSKISGAKDKRIEALKYALSMYNHDDGHYLAIQGELLGLGVAAHDLVSPSPPDISLRRVPYVVAGSGMETEKAEEVVQLLREAELCQVGGNTDGAVAAYMAALEHDPANMDAIDRVADLYKAAGMLTKAQIHYSRMAEKLCSVTRSDLALRCLDKADELIPGSTRILRLTMAEELAASPLIQVPHAMDFVKTSDLPEIELGDIMVDAPPKTAVSVPDLALPVLGGESPDDALRQAIYSIDFQLDYGSPYNAKVEIEQALVRFPGNAELLGRLATAEEKLAKKGPTALQDAPGLLAIADVLEKVSEATDEVNDDTGSFGRARTAEEIYDAFKDEVAKQVGHADYDTCYNLGIGYMEMGLLEPAIDEFKKAMHDPSRRLDCCSMLAMCEEGRGNLGAAVEWLKKGIEDKQFPPSDSAGMRGELEALMGRHS